MRVRDILCYVDEHLDDWSAELACLCALPSVRVWGRSTSPLSWTASLERRENRSTAARCAFRKATAPGGLPRFRRRRR